MVVKELPLRCWVQYRRLDRIAELDNIEVVAEGERAGILAPTRVNLSLSPLSPKHQVYCSSSHHPSTSVNYDIV